MSLLVCIPTYNEAENIALFLQAVFAAAPPDAHALVIDDNSPDGTAAIVEKLIADNSRRLHILKRPAKAGLASAYIAAFDWGLAKNFGIFLEMDADFSHDPKYISIMLTEIETHDVVIGSRNIKGGGVEGWGAMRHFISKGGSLYAQTILGCPIKDLTGGFTMWTKNALTKIGIHSIISKGYSFQIEMKYRAWHQGCRVKEIPIIFVDRKLGTSKMSKKIFVEGLINVWKIKLAKTDAENKNTFKEFIKFGITGGLGTITNLIIFFFCADIFNLPPVPVSIGCFIVSGTQNYFINHRWSFARNMRGAKPSVKRWLLFLCASLAGLAVNIAVMAAVLKYIAPPYKFIAQACGIAAGMFINFVFSKFIVFKEKK
jgi:dolichol-phosphate mannosyltransferase